MSSPSLSKQDIQNRSNRVMSESNQENEENFFVMKTQ